MIHIYVYAILRFGIANGSGYLKAVWFYGLSSGISCSTTTGESIDPRS